MKKINNKTSLFELTKDYPEIKEIMVEIGFEDIIKPGMLQSVGRVMNLEKGGNLKKIGINEMKETFASHGFDLKIL